MSRSTNDVFSSIRSLNSVWKASCLLLQRVNHLHQYNRDPKDEYCESNINKFECDMEHMHQTNANLDYTEANFIAYVNEIKLKIENIFLIKSESKSTSKRTILCNPWITPEVIASVNKKHFLYAQWRKSVTKVNKLGSLELYNIFKIYRKQLKGIIKHAKRSYYSKKFDNAKGNMKKNRALINELRGKKVKQRIVSSPASKLMVI